MKLKLTLASLIALAGVASAATTVTISNFSFAGGLGGTVITDAVGNTLSTFSWAAGSYNGSDFIINGTAQSIVVAPGANTFNGSIANASSLAGNPIIGQNVYVAIGDNANYDLSTQFILFQSAAVWGAEDPVLGGSAATNIDLRVATPVQGSFSLTTPNNAGVSAPFNALNQGITFVPEPSAALLGALGALGLLRRRRI